jgi:hypothetical protein
LSVSNCVHVPLEQPTLAFEHSEKSTCVTSASGVEAVTVYVLGSAALM